MKGRKPDGWSKGLSSTSSYGRKMPKKDRARLVEQLHQETQERARRVARLMRAIWAAEDDDDGEEDQADESSARGDGGSAEDGRDVSSSS
jgi:hypothetical protein